MTVCTFSESVRTLTGWVGGGEPGDTINFELGAHPATRPTSAVNTKNFFTSNPSITCYIEAEARCEAAEQVGKFCEPQDGQNIAA